MFQLYSYQNSIESNSQVPEGESYFVNFVEKAAVRRAIHVGNLTFDSVSWNAFEYLFGNKIN